MPRKIRQLVEDLERAGFVIVVGGKGSHRKFRHPKFPGALILSGQSGDDALHYQKIRHPTVQQMKPKDQYLKFVRWEESDGVYVGYCPDLFPWGGVCHGATEEETYHQICALVAAEVDELNESGKQLPVASTRPMRDAVPA